MHKSMNILLLTLFCLIWTSSDMAFGAQTRDRAVPSGATNVVRTGIDRHADIKPQSQSILPADSVPCIIVTNEEMREVFQIYADLKTRAGSRTEVATVEGIAAEFRGDSLQMQIRNYIRECHAEKHTEWVVLGGDVDVVPPIYAYCLLDGWLTDAYYSNLDYEWNEDGDDRFGEAIYAGDSVDYVPDVYVGRIPCSTAEQADAILDKIIAYQRDDTNVGYQTEALFMGTNVAYPDDQEGVDAIRDSYILLDSLSSYLPSAFNETRLYAVPAAEAKAQFNAGKGLIVNSGQAQNAGSFLTHWTWDWVRERIEHTFLADSMSNAGKYSVFVNLTCFNADLDSPEAVGRHFMQNPQGGGVAYVGASSYNWSTSIFPDFHRAMFNLIFNEGVTEIGKAFALSKQVLTPEDDFSDNMRRSAIYSYLFLGDPQMKMWTATPQVFDIAMPTTVTLDQTSVDVQVASNGYPVPEATVCLSKDPTTYMLATTNDDGIANFPDLSFESEGIATIVVSKGNYFTVERTVEITDLCCVGLRGNIDCSADNQVTMSDLTVLIDHMFITLEPLCCLEEANVDMSTDGLVTMGDLTVLIDHLFINLRPMPPCP